MSCTVKQDQEIQEPASSHVHEGSDCRQEGSGDSPIGHGTDAEQELRSPLQDVSSTSSTTEDGSQAKGKRRAEEVQYPMASTNSVPGPTNSGKKARTRLNMEQKAEVLQLLNNGKKHAEIAQRYACCERTVSMIAKKKGQLELKIKSPGFNGKAKSEKSPGFPEVRDHLDAITVVVCSDLARPSELHSFIRIGQYVLAPGNLESGWHHYQIQMIELVDAHGASIQAGNMSITMRLILIHGAILMFSCLGL